MTTKLTVCGLALGACVLSACSGPPATTADEHFETVSRAAVAAQASRFSLWVPTGATISAEVAAASQTLTLSDRARVVDTPLLPPEPGEDAPGLARA
jgi:hypothetical protein